MIWELIKQIKLGRHISASKGTHSCIWFNFEKFRFFANTTTGRYISFEQIGTKFRCFDSHGIPEIGKFSPPQFVDNENRRIGLLEDPSYVYLQFCTAGTKGYYEPKDVLKYKLQMFKGFVELLNSPQTDAFILIRNPEIFEVSFEYMHFKGGLFSKNQEFLKELLRAHKYFDSLEFTKILEILSNKEPLFSEINEVFEILDNTGTEGVIEKFEIKDSSIIELIRNENCTL